MRKRWIGFVVTVAVAIAVMVAGSLHVHFRWDPVTLGTVTVGEWMQFDGFRLRVDDIVLADSFAPESSGEPPIAADVTGMKLLQVFFTYEHQSGDDEQPACDMWVENYRGDRMSSAGAPYLPGPRQGGCIRPDEPDQYGTRDVFQRQFVSVVTPEPLHTFTVHFSHLQLDGEQRAQMWVLTPS